MEHPSFSVVDDSVGDSERTLLTGDGEKKPWASRRIKITLGVIALVGLLAVAVFLVTGAVKNGGAGQGLATQKENVVQVKWTADEISQRCSFVLREGQKLLEKMRAWTGNKLGLLQLMNKLSLELDNLSSMTGLLKEVAPARDLREVSKKCSLNISSFSSALDLDRRLYEAFKKVENETLADPLAQRLFHKTMRDFDESGVTKDSSTRAKLQVLNDEMEKLSQEYDENLSNDQRRLTIKASDKAKLAGLGDDYIKQRTKDGVVTITTDYPDYFPAIKLIHDSDIRHKLWLLKQGRGTPKNEPLLQQLLNKRAEYAALLGYKSYADLSMIDKMVKGAANCQTFLQKVKALVYDRARNEAEQLLRHKQQDAAHANSTRLLPWDFSYYSEQIRRAKYQVSSEEVRPYFAYKQVRAGVFGTAEALFGVKIVPIEVEAWHSTVEAYHMLDSDGKLLSRFFLDSFPRAHKYKHMAQFPMRKGVEGRQIPEGCLVCNFDQHGHMDHSDVKTFFHEFGHMLHHIFGGQAQKWERFSGVATEWDFVEAPSQMDERWAWDFDTLKTFAKNDEGKVLPKALLQKMINGNRFGRGINTLDQLYLAELSLKLHEGTINASQVKEEVAAAWDIPPPYSKQPGDHILSNFGHLTGYGSNYYTYQWSLAIAFDTFSKFKAEGLRNPKVGGEWRKYVLSKGGQKDAADLVKDFLGRPWAFDAYKTYLMEFPTK